MSEVLDFYQQQAKESLSTIPWLAELQHKGSLDLAKYSFPTRHNEDWKYTAVASFLRERFVQRHNQQDSNAALKTGLQFINYLTIQNGLVDDKSALNHLPAGVIVQSLANGLAQHADKIESYLGQVLQHEHGFQALNTAMLNCGVLIYLPAGVIVEEPIVISHQQSEDNQAVHSRYLIIAEEGSQATIVEEYRGTENSSYFTNTVTELFLAANAKIKHYTIQCESKLAFHIGHLAIQQAEKSEFENHALNLGGKLVRSDLSFYLIEEEAKCLMNGIYAPIEGQHIDHHTTVHHQVPNCQSEQDYKGILTGRSRAVFNGKVVVAKDAQKTAAKQQNKNLLLSTHAEINTKPQLEIFADDVTCAHGATVGQLDEDALFYLATRGIARQEASSYLIHAFAADNLQRISNPKIRDWMTSLLDQQLG